MELRFGWVVSSVELFEALNITNEPPLKLWHNHLPELVNNQIQDRWQMNGYEDRNFKKVAPSTLRHNI